MKDWLIDEEIERNQGVFFAEGRLCSILIGCLQTRKAYKKCLIGECQRMSSNRGC